MNEVNIVANYINYLYKENKELQQRLDKAIEYIKKNYFEEVYKTKGTTANDLLNILGDDNE